MVTSRHYTMSTTIFSLSDHSRQLGMFRVAAVTTTSHRRVIQCSTWRSALPTKYRIVTTLSLATMWRLIIQVQYWRGTTLPINKTQETDRDTSHGIYIRHHAGMIVHEITHRTIMISILFYIYNPNRPQLHLMQASNESTNDLIPILIGVFYIEPTQNDVRNWRHSRTTSNG